MSTIAARPEAGRAAAGAGWLLWSLPLAGAVLASALPPVGFLPAALAPALLFVMLLGAGGYWRAFLAAWLFAFGFHLAGLYWVGIAFFAEAERFGVLAVPGVLGLAAVLAGLGALPLGLLGLRRWRSPWAATLVFAGLWCLGEAVRGRLGVQFPWNPLSLALTAHDATLQPVALLGTTGMSFVLAWLAALVGLGWHGREQRWPAAGVAAALIVAMAGFGSWRLTADLALETPAEPVHLRLVQGNIAQHHKWDPALRQRWFQRHLDLSVAPGEVQPDVVLWPESSVPYPIEEMAEVRDLVGAVVAPGGHVVLGSNFYDDGVSPPILHNSVYGIAAGGIVQQRYDKVDLVPFGEFLPFRPLFGRLGLEALAVGSIDFLPGCRPRHDGARRPAAVQPAGLLRGGLPGAGNRRDGARPLDRQRHQRCLVRHLQRPAPACRHGADAGGRGRPAAGPCRQYRHLAGHRCQRPRPRQPAAGRHGHARCRPAGGLGDTASGEPGALARPGPRGAGVAGRGPCRTTRGASGCRGQARLMAPKVVNFGRFSCDLTGSGARCWQPAPHLGA